MGDSIGKGFETAALQEPIIALVAFVILGCLFVFVKYYLPHRAAIEERKAETERYRIESQERSEISADERERERIKLTERQTAIQEESARALEALATQVAATNQMLSESRIYSQEVGGRVERIDKTTSVAAKKIDEMHHLMLTGRLIGGTDE